MRQRIPQVGLGPPACGPVGFLLRLLGGQRGEIAQDLPVFFGPLAGGDGEDTEGAARPSVRRRQRPCGDGPHAEAGDRGRHVSGESWTASSTKTGAPVARTVSARRRAAASRSAAAVGGLVRRVGPIRCADHRHGGAEGPGCQSRRPIGGVRAWESRRWGGGGRRGLNGGIGRQIASPCRRVRLGDRAVPFIKGVASRLLGRQVAAVRVSRRRAQTTMGRLVAEFPHALFLPVELDAAYGLSSPGITTRARTRTPIGRTFTPRIGRRPVVGCASRTPGFSPPIAGVVS